MENEQDFSEPLLESLAEFDRDTQSWRMSPDYLKTVSVKSSESWPRSGMMLSGTCYRLPALVPLTDVTGLSLLPTASANDWKGTAKLGQRSGQLDEFAENVPDWVPCPCCEDYICLLHSPSHVHECQCSAIESRETGSSPMDPYSEATRGRLSINLSEWLMGFPDNWTELSD